tara:strand:- start:2380 stop:3465 length:1086 start_codon:yes stop_codon:yes gene_type:complete
MKEGGKNKCVVLISPDPSMPPKSNARKRKLSPDPPDENEIDLTEKGPVRNFDDLMKISKYVKDMTESKKKSKKKKKPVGIQRLGFIYDRLLELDKLVGLKDLKDQITMQIIFFVQDMNKDEMMHTAIMGPPGMCKTTVSEILAKIYADLGFLSSGHVIAATRADLVGQFLGETAIKTQAVLETAEGGVLLLDEAYQLGDPRNRDSFASECVNTLNQYLSENKEDFMCIIAGYKTKLYQNFFSMNPGLDRRFTWKFTLQPYSVDDLLKIFEYQIDKDGWSYDKESNVKNYIEKNRNFFKNNGGDTQVFFDKCKMNHAQRVFTLKDYKKKYLTKEDLEGGFKSFQLLKGETEKTDTYPSSMYI